MKKILQFFDKLEDFIRHRLSHQPLWYAFIGGVGVVLFWRGVWHTADYFSNEILAISSGGKLSTSLDSIFLMDGLVSIVIGALMLLMTGVFVSSFIGNEVILSGLRKEKKLAEKTEEEVQTELEKINGVEKEIKIVAERLSEMENILNKKK